MHRRPRRLRSACVFAACGAVALAIAPAALAKGHATHHSTAPTLSAPIATGLAGPLQLAVDHHSIYVSQAFAGLLTKLGPVALAPTSPAIRAVRSPVSTWAGATSCSTRRRPPTRRARSRPLRSTACTAGRRRSSPTCSCTRPCTTSTRRTTTASRRSTRAARPSSRAEIGPAQYTGMIDSHPYAVAVSGRHTTSPTPRPTRSTTSARAATSGSCACCRPSRP